MPESVRARADGARDTRSIVQGPFSSMVGGGQSVMRDYAAGVNYGASDPRKDGAAIPEPFLYPEGDTHGKRSIATVLRPYRYRTHGDCHAVLAAAGGSWRLASCMVLISSPQYVWALFTQPLTTGARSVAGPRLQITFSILIVVQTFLSPCAGCAGGSVRSAAAAVDRRARHRPQLDAGRAGLEPARCCI